MKRSMQKKLTRKTYLKVRCLQFVVLLCLFPFFETRKRFTNRVLGTRRSLFVSIVPTQNSIIVPTVEYSEIVFRSRSTTDQSLQAAFNGPTDCDQFNHYPLESFFFPQNVSKRFVCTSRKRFNVIYVHRSPPSRKSVFKQQIIHYTLYVVRALCRYDQSQREVAAGISCIKPSSSSTTTSNILYC